jgi:EH_Signature domain
VSLLDFEDRLRAANFAALAAFKTDTSGIRAELGKLRKWLNGDRELRAPSAHLQIALLRFRQAGGAPECPFADLRLVCAASPMSIPVGGATFCLLEQLDLLASLLRQVKIFQADPRRFRRLYRGLLNCYFITDPSENRAKGEGWERLRCFLRDHVDCLGTGSIQPRWVEVIQEHRNLLDTEPCLRYSRDLLRGNNSEFAQVESELAIGGSSWIGRMIVLSIVKAAVALDDSQFNSHIPALLEKIEQERYASLLDSCLAQLLERYCRGTGRPPHANLFGCAVRHWKNPRLATNAGRWGRVSEATRKTVFAWLKLDLIQQFFELLASDGNGDRRRLDFWIKYHESMDDMYFALGSYARDHPGRDLRELRSRLTGRGMSLTGAGGPDNNAFLMCFGDYVIVECGNSGSACRVYRRSAGLPFDLDRDGKVTGKQLREDDLTVLWLQHKDGIKGYRSWESRFEFSLLTLFRIRRAPDTMPDPWGRGGLLSSCSTSELSSFCTAFGCGYEDNRKLGGCEWIGVPAGNKVAEDQLRLWGFVLSTARQKWWRAG